MGITYEEQLKRKQEYVRKLFAGEHVEETRGMKDPYYYRHKIYASFGKDKNGMIRAGMYEENSHRLVYPKDCLIQHPKANAILKSICEIAGKLKLQVYNEDTGTGVLRHAYIRVSHHTGEIMVVIVTGSRDLPGSRRFVSELLDRHPEITTVIHNRNSRRTSMILGDWERVLYGDGTIIDAIDGISFRISSRSFYQVNPLQTASLYRTALTLADIKKTDTVLDACCGIGTISLLAAKDAKHVTGIEVVSAAVRDARYNAKENLIRNASFYCADEKTYLLEADEKYDVTIMDPPRSGMSEAFLNAVSSGRIVYISCNPQTQKRDTDILKAKGYKIITIIPFDKVGGQAVLGRQGRESTPWLTERHGYDPTSYRATRRPRRGIRIF